MRMARISAIAAGAALAAQPCFAADDFRDTRVAEVRAGAFAGLRLRLPLDSGADRRPTARLQLTGIRQLRDDRGATRTGFADGIELGARRDGRAALTVSGRNPFESEERLGVGGSTGTTLLIVGGVVLVVFVLASVADAMPTPGPDEGAFD